MAGCASWVGLEMWIFAWILLLDSIVSPVFCFKACFSAPKLLLDNLAYPLFCSTATSTWEVMRTLELGMGEQLEQAEQVLDWSRGV